MSVAEAEKSAELPRHEHSLSPSDELDSLERKLDEMGGSPLPTSAIISATGLLPWSYDAPLTDKGERKLVREGATTRKEENALVPPAPAEIRRNGETVLIVSDEITPSILLHVIKAEKRIARPDEDDQPALPEEFDLGVSSELIHPFQISPFRLEKIEPFDDYDKVLDKREQVILHWLPHIATQTLMAKKFVVSVSTLSRTMDKLRDKLDARIDHDLAIKSVGLGIGNIDSLPSGRTQSIESFYRSYIRGFYSLDKDMRNYYRKVNPNTTNTNFHRARIMASAKNRRELIMLAVRDGVIDLPDKKELLNELNPDSAILRP